MCNSTAEYHGRNPFVVFRRRIDSNFLLLLYNNIFFFFFYLLLSPTLSCWRCRTLMRVRTWWITCYIAPVFSLSWKKKSDRNMEGCCCCCCAVHRAAQMSRLFSLSLLSIIYVRFHTRSYLYTDGWWIVCCPTTEWLLGSSSRHCCRYSENLGFSHIFYTELCAVSAVFRKAILCCLMANKSEKRKERTRHSVALCIAAMSNDLYTQERFKTITSGLPTAEIKKKKKRK